MTVVECLQPKNVKQTTSETDSPDCDGVLCPPDCPLARLQPRRLGLEYRQNLALQAVVVANEILTQF